MMNNQNKKLHVLPESRLQKLQCIIGKKVKYPVELYTIVELAFQ